MTSRSSGVPGLVGVLAAGYFLALLPSVRPVPGGLLAGSVLLAVAGAGLGRGPARRAGRGLLALAGGLGIGWAGGLAGPAWMHWLVVAGSVVGGAAVADLDRRYRAPGTAGALLLITTLGVLITVPDTEEALLLAAATGVAVGFGRLAGVPCLGSAGSFVMAGLVAWVALRGGFGRPGSVVGAVASLGLLAVEPLAAGLSRVRPDDSRTVPPAALLVGQVVIVLITSRWAGLEESVRSAFVVAGAALALGLAFLLGVRRRWGPGAGGR